MTLPLFLLSLPVQGNSPLPPPTNPPTHDTVAPYLKLPNLQFPNRTTEYQAAVAYDQEQAAIAEAARQAEIAAKEAQDAALAVQAAQRVAPGPIAPPAASSMAENDIQAIITEWANYYGVSPGWLLEVAKCESGYSVTIVNHHYTAPDGGQPTGLFQFVPSTFSSNGGVDIYSAEDQAKIAAKMFSEGQSGQWECR